MQNPTDALVASKIGGLELTNIRLSWALEQYKARVAEMAAAAKQHDALIAAKDSEIERLKEAAKAPELLLDNLPSNPYANGEARH